MIFTLVSILNIPAFTFFIGANTSTDGTSNSANSWLAWTTLGNLGSSQLSCGSVSNTSDSAFLQCSYGTLSTLGVFGIGMKQSSCDNYGADLSVSSTCNYTSDGSSSIKSADKQSLLSLFSSDCNGRQSCNFNLSKITFTDSNCPSTSTYYIWGDCKSSSALGLYKSSISIIVVCCDLGVSYLIWILL